MRAWRAWGLRAAVGVAIAFSVSGGAARADLIVYDDEQTFLAATPDTLATLDFATNPDTGEEFPSRDTQFQYGLLTMGGVEFDGEGYLVIRGYEGDYLYGSQTRFDANGEETHTFLTITLPGAGSRYVGFHFRPFDYYHASGIVQIEVSTGETFTYTDFAHYAYKYIGLESSAPIEWVRIAMTSGPAPGYSVGTPKIDDFSYIPADAQSAPEPSSISLALLGLAALTRMGRRAAARGPRSARAPSGR